MMTIGCLIDCSCQSADSLNQRTVEEAVSRGMVLDRADKNLLARFDYDVTRDDDSESLSWLADEALDFLNGLEDLPAYCSFYFEDNSLFLLPNLEDVKGSVGFISSRRQDYPSDDFRGEWLHVSDHGNATLYVRTDDGDRDVWGMV